MLASQDGGGRGGVRQGKPSVYEVARRAGVSTATVSRVLAGRERVLPPTRDKVLTAVVELGYVPSGAAKDLAARRTGVLGLCLPDLSGDQDLVASLDNALNDRAIQRDFARDPISWAAHTYLSIETMSLPG